MSVLIKNIKISKSCAECRFCVNGFTDAAPVYECACESYENVSVLVDDHGKPFNFRPDWCPLVEVKEPHGRLLDEDNMIEEIYPFVTFGSVDYAELKRVLKTMNAVIEAEGSAE